MQRHDGRAADQLRPLKIQRGFVRTAQASVLIEAGRTMVLCTASVEKGVPPWRRPRDPAVAIQGWVTGEYSMLPGSTSPRKQRERSKVDGRTTEIQRLIGRSLRAVVDFAALGDHTITVDCDVLQADGGTRTTSITGGYIALADAISAVFAGGLGVGGQPILLDSVAAISVGVVSGTPVLDLDYSEDSTAEVDMNVVMTGSGGLIEIQGTAEGAPFSRAEMDAMVELAQNGIGALIAKQRAVLVS